MAIKRRGSLLASLEAPRYSGSSSLAGGSSSQSKRRCQSGRRDVEDKVVRTIADHFSDFSAVDLDATRRLGQTLRERLTAEHSNRQASGGRISANVIRALRVEYMSPEDPIHQLQIRNANQTFNPDLRQALEASEHANPARRTKQPLYAFFATTTVLNQKETVVLLRTVISLNPKTSVTIRKHIVALLRFIVRIKLDRLFPDEVSKFKSMFDETLTLTWTTLKGTGMSMSAFWDAYGPLYRVLGDPRPVEEILDEQECFSNVKEQLALVTSSTKLGAKMFGMASVMVRLEAFSSKVDAKVLEIENSGNEITQTTLDAASETLCEFL